MKTIKNDTKNEIIIKNSRFICYLYKIKDLNDISNYLTNIKNIEKDATHYCYAYIIDNNKKCSDDKEPSGTAGMPILNVLEKNNMNNVLCIVIRYFGGIKLGAGGLVRAYTNSVTTCLENNIVELKKGLKIEIIFSYDKTKIIDNLLKDYIIDKVFDDSVKYIILIDYELYKIINEKLKNMNIKINIIEENIVI